MIRVFKLSCCLGIVDVLVFQRIKWHHGVQLSSHISHETFIIYRLRPVAAAGGRMRHGAGADQRHTTGADGNISPRAESVLRPALDFLAKSPAFSLKAEIWREHVDEAGQKIQYSRTVTMDVKRPDGLRLEIGSPNNTRGFWYDGKTLTILDRKHNFYSTTEMPDTLDKVAGCGARPVRHRSAADRPGVERSLPERHGQGAGRAVFRAGDGAGRDLSSPRVHPTMWTGRCGSRTAHGRSSASLSSRTRTVPARREFTALITHWIPGRPHRRFRFCVPAAQGGVKVEMRADGD